MTMKICTKCGEVKPPIAYSKQAGKPGGLRSHCKACVKIASAAYYVANSEKLNARSAAYGTANPEKRKAWQADNKDKTRASSAKWRAANPEKARASIVAWHTANIEKHKANGSAWYAANKDKVMAGLTARRKSNPEAYRLYNQNRRARANGGKLSNGLAERLHKLQRGKCACGCKQPLSDDYHLDHIMPLALGGSNTDDNIQLLRATCNMQKKAKHPVDFMRQRGYLL